MHEFEFIKIENKTMPKDNIKNIDLNAPKNSQAGFTNLIFLAGGVVTAFMWAILMVIGK